MDKQYMCYCGLYCENCATKSKVEPAVKALYSEMQKAGFEDVMGYLTDGETFWGYLKGMAEEGTCTSCREGSGNPTCEVRICAQEKSVEMCAYCESYPCDKLDELLEGYPILKEDNALLKNGELGEWVTLQDKRKAEGYAYNQSN